MNHFKLSRASLDEWLWREASPAVISIVKIDRVLRALDPGLQITEDGPGQISGCCWVFSVSPDSLRNVEGAEIFNVHAGARWKIAASYRGAFITAVSWRDPNEREDQITSPALVALAKKLAEDLHLAYLDAHELRALQIPWDELQGDAEMRLDYSEMPNAFNLLFYE